LAPRGCARQASGRRFTRLSRQLSARPAALLANRPKPAVFVVADLEPGAGSGFKRLRRFRYNNKMS
jgi:hypothetical protein